MATRWLSPADAAKQLAVSESTVWRLLRHETLPSVKVGGRRRVAASALGRVVRSSRRWSRPSDLSHLTLDDPMFALAGRFRSDGKGPGSADKHAHLGATR